MLAFYLGVKYSRHKFMEMIPIGFPPQDVYRRENMRQYPLVYRCRLGRSGALGLRLCVLWSTGVILGWLLCPGQPGQVGQLLDQATLQPTQGFVGLGVGLIPLALTLAFSALGWRLPVWLLCAVRGALLGLGLGWLSVCYGQAAGLLAVLLLFSLLASSPVLLWYWWRCLGAEDGCRLGDFLWSLAGISVIWAADHWMIAPFLVRVMSR